MNVVGTKYCMVCKVKFLTQAEYALHEFGKKHCDNLVKLYKNKPVSKLKSDKNKPLPKPEESKVKTETVAAGTGTITKYGYFVSGEAPSVSVDAYGYCSKEYNYEYDPYIQKYASDLVEKPVPVSVPNETPSLCMPSAHITTFARKKKKVKTCQICSLTLATVPEYEAHLKSSQHIWKLKMNGMGVSAHFVKASTDLHTTDVNEVGSEQEQMPFTINPSTTATLSTGQLYPGLLSLFCDDCDLLLNSEQQFNAHVAGKAHQDQVAKRQEQKAKKEKLEQPVPNQLYCYTCKIPLNNLYQYNEHKNGKKHQIKCKQLIKQGILIPPEERPSSWSSPRIPPDKPVIYPELYEKYVLHSDKQLSEKTSASLKGTQDVGEKEQSPTQGTSTFECSLCQMSFRAASSLDLHTKSEAHINRKNNTKCMKCGISFKTDRDWTNHLKMDKCNEKITDGNIPSDIATPSVNESSSKNTVFENKSNSSGSKTKDEFAEFSSNCDRNSKTKSDVRVTICCKVCQQTFSYMEDLEVHLQSEDHAVAIVAKKGRGATVSELISMIYKYEKNIKPDKYGRYCCTLCCVTSANTQEYDQHFDSTVHNHAENEFRRKKIIEIREAIQPNLSGQYFCKLCKTAQNTAVDFNKHLHGIFHKSAKRTENVKRYQKLRSKYKQAKGICKGWKTRDEKNPGVRTKICGTAKNLHTGEMASIPNLEQLEPKIDTVKNVTVGLSRPLTRKKGSPSTGSSKSKLVKQTTANSSGIPPLLNPRDIRLSNQQPFYRFDAPTLHGRFRNPNSNPYLRNRYSPYENNLNLRYTMMGSRFPNPAIPFHNKFPPPQYSPPNYSMRGPFPTRQFYNNGDWRQHHGRNQW